MTNRLLKKNNLQRTILLTKELADQVEDYINLDVAVFRKMKKAEA